ncbi:MAG: heme exporter protein CcmD [Porticoccaceae bacterium]|nr:heme exporter protein CcmD [Porticoccaceae bacterium]
MFENFQFDSLADFMAMSGHGPYVWSAYGISALVLFYLAVLPLRRRREFLATLNEQQSEEA